MSTLDLVLAMDLLHILDVPAEGAQHGINQCCLGVLLKRCTIALNTLSYLLQYIGQGRHGSPSAAQRFGNSRAASGVSEPIVARAVPSEQLRLPDSTTPSGCRHMI